MVLRAGQERPASRQHFIHTDNEHSSHYCYKGISGPATSSPISGALCFSVHVCLCIMWQFNCYSKPFNPDLVMLSQSNTLYETLQVKT